MNKGELEKEIAKTKEQLARLQQALDNKRYERWKPEIREQYYFVNSYGVANYSMWDNAYVDKKCYDFYNCFETKEEAEQKAEKILVRRQLGDIARRLNKGDKLDWTDELQDKFYLECYQYDANKYKVIQDFNNHCIREGVYCLDENFKDIAIKEIGEERLIKYLKGE